MRYAADVMSGRVVAGRLLRRAVARHVHDLEHGHERGLVFVPDYAQDVITFFGLLRHSKGEWGRQPIRLEPWQQFIIWVLFGWRRTSDGLRRFRTIYEEVARKNGKSTFWSGIGLYLATRDDEPGAEVYAAATKRAQAEIVFGEAVSMVRKSPTLRGLFEIAKRSLSIVETASKFEPLGADHDTLDGLNVHCALVDEVHAHPSRGMWEVLDTATGARRQPLMAGFTTAGADRTSLCWDLRQYSVQVLEGFDVDAGIKDDTWCAFIFTLDEDDDWTNEKFWPKANPNLGVSVKLDDLRRKRDKAVAVPALQNDFRRKHLDQWMQQINRAINMQLWDDPVCAGGCPENELEGRVAHGAFDIAKSEDFSAWGLVFPPVDAADPWELLVRLWIPEHTAEARERDHKVPITQWADEGLLTITPEGVIDYEMIEAQIVADSKLYQIQRIGYDPWNALQFAIGLRDNHGADVVEFPQTVKHFNEPTKLLLELLRQKQVRHRGHKVLRWMADNLSVRHDPNGNIRPVKPEGRNPLKIDGMVAVLMAIGLAISTEGGTWDGEVLTI